MTTLPRYRSVCVVIAGLALSGLTAGAAAAGEFNLVLNYGDPAPVWKDLPGIDGKMHSLADLKSKETVVVVFTCNSCDYAREYEDRIMALDKKYGGPAGKTTVVAINVNKVPADSLENLKARATERGFKFAYLYDETQEIAKKFGAIRTPEFFVLNKDRRIVYMGSLDDSPDAAKAKTNYVAAAIDAALAGRKPSVIETVAIGCTIRFERRRRNRKKPANP
ncbi:MAG: thioredoxin family protein [Pirellulaceae bacterium]|nr:thioredoxin family protein [Pirellulaceae bacterium]MDP7017347.1 thioredoxin family protein [Pirellulaceae bacterium]